MNDKKSKHVLKRCRELERLCSAQREELELLRAQRHEHEAMMERAGSLIADLRIQNDLLLRELDELTDRYWRAQWLIGELSDGQK